MLRVHNQILGALKCLGILAEFEAMLRTRESNEHLLQGIEEIKNKAKETYKELAFKHHPDRGGDEEKMKQLSEAMQVIDKMRFELPRPRPVIHRHVIVVNMGDGVHYTTHASGTSNFFWSDCTGSTTGTGF